MVPAHARLRHVELNKLQPLLRSELASLSRLKLKKSELGVVTSGVAAKYVEEAVMRLKLEPSILRIAAYPMNDDAIVALINNSRKILVIEELEPVIEDALARGASVSMGSGFAAACGEDREIVSVIGDSTFVHTGVPGLINAVYNGAKMTLVILDNTTTAMTGHQPHPCTGETATGTCNFQTPMEDLIKAVGVQGLYVVDPYNLSETEEAFVKAKDGDGVQVVIALRPCLISAKKAGALSKTKKRVTSSFLR